MNHTVKNSMNDGKKYTRTTPQLKSESVINVLRSQKEPTPITSDEEMTNNNHKNKNSDNNKTSLTNLNKLTIKSQYKTSIKTKSNKN